LPIARAHEVTVHELDRVKHLLVNTDQGSQFTADSFTGVLRAAEVRISMDGKGRCLDNVFVERLWRSLKYEEVYLHEYRDLIEARAGIGRCALRQ
jgi:putative transposase